MREDRGDSRDFRPPPPLRGTETVDADLREEEDSASTAAATGVERGVGTERREASTVKGEEVGKGERDEEVEGDCCVPTSGEAEPSMSLGPVPPPRPPPPSPSTPSIPVMGRGGEMEREGERPPHTAALPLSTTTPLEGVDGTVSVAPLPQSLQWMNVVVRDEALRPSMFSTTGEGWRGEDRTVREGSDRKGPDEKD